jgi:hypothetical protein
MNRRQPNMTPGICSSERGVLRSDINKTHALQRDSKTLLTEPVVELVGVHGLWRQEVGVVVVGVVQAARVPLTDSIQQVYNRG